MKKIAKSTIALILVLVFIVGMIPTPAFSSESASDESHIEHSWIGWEVTAEPGCTENGSQKRSCSICGDAETEPIPASGHSWGEWTVTAEPTCTADGEKVHSCTVCGETVTETIPAPGHSWGEWTVTAEPTCAEDGEKVHSCTACGETVTETIPALGHTWGEWTVTAEPTCAEDGEKVHSCTVCGETVTETIPALGHTWGEWTQVVEPDCANEGSHTHTCTACGETATETIPALGHAWGEWTQVVEPDCANEGSHTHTCTACGETVTETIPALGHTWGEWTETVAPTCTKEGEHEHVCTVCGEKEIEKVPGADHEWIEDNGEDPVKCKVCGILKLIADGGSFDMEFDGERWIIAGDEDADVEGYGTWSALFAGVPFTGNWGDDLVAAAVSQIGYHESYANYALSESGQKNGYTRYGDWYGFPYGDWCAMFISFCMHYAGIPESSVPYASGCAAWANALSARGMFDSPANYSPKPGDLIFYYADTGAIGHVGIVHFVDYNYGVIHTIEGNIYDQVTTREVGCYDGSIAGYGIMPENPALSAAAEIERVEKTIRASVDGRTVTVSGMLPTDAELSVVAIPLDAAEEILSAQADESLSDKKVVVAFDVTILSGGKKYDLEEYGDSITVSVSDIAEEITGVMHVKIDVTDGNGGLDQASLNAAMTQKQDSEVLNADAAEDGAVFFDLTSCSVSMLLANSKGGEATHTKEEVAEMIKEHSDEHFLPRADGTYLTPTIEVSINKHSGFPENPTAGSTVKYDIQYAYITSEDTEWTYFGTETLFDEFYNNVLSIKLPAGLLLVNAGLGILSRDPDDDDITKAHTYYLNIPNPKPYGSGLTATDISIYIGNNGTEDSVRPVTFSPDMVTMSTTFDVLNKYSQDPSNYEVVGTYTQTVKATDTGFSTSSPDVWSVEKTNKKAELITGTDGKMKAVFTWDVGVGLLVSGEVAVNESNYGRLGREFLESMLLKDSFTLDLDLLTGTTTDITEDAQVFQIQKYGENNTLGQAVQLTPGTDVKIWGSNPDAEAELLMNHKALVEIDGKGTYVDTPTYTKYLVTVEVPVKSEWIRLFPDLRANRIIGDNTATVTPAFPAGHQQPDPETDSPEQQEVPLPATPPAMLRITKMFTDWKGTRKDYDTADFAPKGLYGAIEYSIAAGQVFTVYQKKSDGTYEPVEGFSGGTSYEHLQASTDYYLVPGIAYTVTETLSQSQTHAMTPVGDTSASSTPKKGDQWKPVFENKETAGSITIIKKDDSGNKLKNVGFTLEDWTGTAVGTEKYTDGNGRIKFDRLPYGQYTLKETHPLDGYAPTIPTTGLPVTVPKTQDGQEITDITLDVENKASTSRLVLTKFVGYATGSTPTDIATKANENYLGRFTLEKSLDGGTTWTTLESGLSVNEYGQISRVLPAFEGTTVIKYRFTEQIPAGYYDPVTLSTTTSSVETTLVDDHGHAYPALTHPVEVSMYNRTLMKITAKKNFYDIKNDGDRTAIAKTTTVQLYAYVQETESLTLVGDPQTFGRVQGSGTQTNELNAVWSNLPAFDANGNKITYVIKETDVDGYNLDWTNSELASQNLKKKTINGTDYLEVLFSSDSEQISTLQRNYQNVVPVTMFKRNRYTNSFLSESKFTVYDAQGNIAKDAKTGNLLNNIEIESSSGYTFFLVPGQNYTFKETTLTGKTTEGVPWHWLGYGDAKAGGHNGTVNTNDAGKINLSGTSQPALYNAGGNNRRYYADIYNQVEPIIKITKKSSTGTPSGHIAGAKFAVFVKDETTGLYTPFPSADDQYVLDATNDKVTGKYLTAGATFYFAEVAVPTGYLDPNEHFDLYQALDSAYVSGTVQGGEYDGRTLTFHQVKPTNVGNSNKENIFSCEFKNIPDTGTLTVVKYLDGKKATGYSSFEITIENDNGTDPVKANISSSTAAAAFTLPVYKEDGTKITYTIKEYLSEALSNKYYKVFDGQSVQMTIGEPTSTVIVDGETQELRVENATKITYHANKVFHSAWSMGRDTAYPGATIGLFAKNTESGNWELVTGLKDLQGNLVQNPQQSDAYGNVNFAGLERNVEYKLVELDTGDPAVFPYQAGYKNVPPDKGSTTSIPDGNLADYNVLTLTAAETRDNTDKTDFPLTEQVMVNTNHWVQFHITKWLYHEPYPASAPVSYKPSADNGDTLIDNAVFELYRVVMPEGISSVGYPDTGFGNAYTQDPYVWKKINNYSSGTLYTPDGLRLSGEFLTDSEQSITDRYVYLLVEKNPGPTGVAINPGFKYTFWHEKDTNFTIRSITDDEGTFTPRNLTYTMDTVNSEKVVNDKSKGTGPGVIYLASIRIAKWKDSYDKDTGHLTNNYEPLPDARFQILIPGIKTPLAELTVGLDSHYAPAGSTPPAIAQTGTYQLIPKDDGTFTLIDYETEERLSDDLTVEAFTFGYEGRTFTGYRLLVYVKEVSAPDGYAFYGGETGFPMWLCFANILKPQPGEENPGGVSWVFNDAYYVRESDNIYPLAENQEGTSLFITNASTKDYTIAYSEEDPGKYRIVNYPTENTMVTGYKYGYSPTAATIGMTEAQLDQLSDSDIDRLPLEGVVMLLQKKVGSTWKYWEYLADRETDNPSLAQVKTLRDGSFHFERGLPMGTYRLWETSLGTKQGNENYEMVYSEAHPRIFTVSKATVNLSIYNPKKVSLCIVKQDAAGSTLDGATFTLGSLTAVRQQDGSYLFANVVSGEYKLTETKAGYTSSYLQKYLRSLFPASPSTEEQAQLDELIALVTGGTFIGYNYSYSNEETNSQATLASISPSFLQEGKASLGLTVKNPSLVSVKLKKVEEGTTVGLNQAAFQVFYKAFDDFGGADEDLVVTIPEAAFTATSTSAVRDAFTGWASESQSTKTVNGENGVILLTGREPGVYVFYETSSDTSHAVIKDSEGKNIFYTVVVTGGIPFHSISVVPNKATIKDYRNGASGTENRDIPTWSSGTGYGDDVVVAVTAENRPNVSVKVIKDVDAGEMDLTALTPQTNWEIQLDVYDGPGSDARRVATATITNETSMDPDTDRGVYFKRVANSGNVTDENATFAIDKTYYLEETIKNPTAHFELNEVLRDDTAIPASTVESETGKIVRYPFTPSSTTGFKLTVKNDWMFGRVTFQKVDERTHEPLPGAKFEKVCYWDTMTESWVEIEDAKVNESETLPGTYIADIPLVSKDLTKYGIFETSAPGNYILKPDVPLEVELSLADNVKSDNLSMPNTKGKYITVHKYGAPYGSETLPVVADGDATFTIYSKGEDGKWVAEEVFDVKDGEVKFLVYPNKDYAIAETSYNDEKYNGLEGIYNGTEKLTSQVIDGIEYYGPINIDSDLEIRAYNYPNIKPMIEKQDVGGYAGTEEFEGTNEETAIKATMAYSIFAIVTDDSASADYLPANASRADVEAFMGSHTALLTGETDKYDQTVLVNGTYDVWESDDLTKRYDPEKSYLLVETKIDNENPEAYDTLRKDDPRVKWFRVIQPGDASPFILDNIYGNATVTLTKSPVENSSIEPESDIAGNAVDTLLSGDRKLVFTIIPKVSGKNQMLSSFVLEENGITETPAVDGFQYKYTGILVGQPSHDVRLFNKAPGEAPIKAIVEFYDAPDSTVPLGTKVVTDFGVPVSASEIPVGTTRFTITYTSDKVVEWTEGVFDDTYCLGEQFRVQPTKVYVTALKQPNGTPGHGVDPITELRNDAKVTLEYPKWNKTGGKDEPVKVDPTANATVLVNPIEIPMVEITKRVDKQAVSFGDADFVTLTYTLTVSNKSASNTNFIDPVVLDILPTAGSYKAGSAEFVITEPVGAVEKLKLDVQTMPGAASVISADGETISEPENAVIFYLTDADDSPCHGLKPGTTVKITYQAEVRSTAPLFASDLENDAYLSSTEKCYYTTANPYGRSFTNDSGDFGAELSTAAQYLDTSAPKDALRREQGMEGNKQFKDSYADQLNFVWLYSKASTQINDLTQVKPVKAVWGDRDTGFHDTGVGYATRTNSNASDPDHPDVATDFQHGNVKWRLSVANGWTQSNYLNDLVFGDVIPKPGDGRQSDWENIMHGVLSVTNENSELSYGSDYQVFYYIGSIGTAEKAVTDALKDRTLLNGNEWIEASAFESQYGAPDYRRPPENNPYRSINAFVVKVNKDIHLARNTGMIVIFQTDVIDVPDDATFFDDYAFRTSHNVFYFDFCYQHGTGEDPDLYYMLRSNPVSVTLVDKPVEIQGDLWIDEDWDARQDLDGNRRTYTGEDGYAIINQLVAAMKFTVTDMRENFSDGTITDDIGTMADHDGGESIKHFRFINLGASEVLNQDELYPNGRLNPLALRGRDAYNYVLTAQLSNISPEVLDIFDITDLGPTHYMSDYPDKPTPDDFRESVNFLDNNFDGSGQRYVTYPFFIPYSTVIDQSKDIGFRMTRDLVIRKVASDNDQVRIPNTEFSIYGPFKDTTLGFASKTPAYGCPKDSTGKLLPLSFSGDVGNYVLDPDGEITVLVTDSQGEIRISGLNWWKEYEIRETKANEESGFSIDLTVAALSENTNVTRTEYDSFMLLVPGKAKTDKPETVKVTDPRGLDFEFVKLSAEVTVDAEGVDTISTGDPLAGATFGLFTDEACTTPLKNGDENVTSTSDSDGKVRFTLLPYGTYYMKETSLGTNQDAYWLNTTVYKVHVVPKTNTEEAHVEVTVVSGSGTETDVDAFGTGMLVQVKDADGHPLKYQYEILNVKVKVKAKLIKVDKDNQTKKLPGAKFGLFSDAACQTTPLATVTTDSSGEASFGWLEPGTYYLKETEPPEGYPLSNTIYSLVIDYSVSTGGDGSRSYTLTVTFDGNNVTLDSGKATFSVTVTNTFVPVKLKIPVKKEITNTTGTAPAKEATFTFTIAAAQGSPSDTPLPGLATVTIKGAGSATFGEIIYTKAGTYAYKVTETACDDSTHYNPLDSTEWTVEVKVENDSIEGLKITSYKIKPNGGDTITATVEQCRGEEHEEGGKKYILYMPATPELAVKFDNPFTPTPVKLKIPVEKTVKIKPDIEQPNLVFYFDLTAKDGAPMPASSSGSTVTINWPDESSGEFGEITFTETGVYQYTVAERAGTEPGVVYDTTPRTVVVTVTINENDELEAHFTVTGGGTSSTADKPVEFTNTYDNGSLRIKKTVTGNRGNKKQSFPFLVEFFDANWKEITTQSYSYTKYTSSGQEIHPGFKSGETIYLRDGEYAVFTGLPVGIRYKVTETNSHGHYASSTGETGKIVANKIATAAFKNCRSDVPKTGETDLLPVTVPIMGASGIGMILTALFGKKRKPRKDK